MKSTPLLVTGLLTLCSGAAHATLTLVAPEDFQGSGLGSVNTILTIQSPGSSSDESGSVAWNGTSDTKTGDFLSGASQTRTRTFADLGVAAASDLRVVFNALEPGSDAQSITLSGLTLNVYDRSGATVFSASTPQSYPFADTFTGAGNSGFVFALDSTEAAQLQTVFDPSLHVGLSAQASDATGGFETFFAASTAAPVAPVPEPGTYALMLAGVGVLGFVARRRL